MTKSREETQAEWAKNMETVQKEHPEMDAKLDTAWWKPAADFSFDVKAQLDEPTNAKLNDILSKLFSQNLSLEDKEKTMQEARECLKDHPDLMKQFDSIFKATGPDFWSVIDGLKGSANTGAK